MYKKAEYWRAYTISLLSQTPEAEASLGDPDLAREFLDLFCKLDGQESTPRPRYIQKLQEICKDAKKLAADFRCQRNCYEVDNSIQLGEPYNDSTMIDPIFTIVDDGKVPVVSCIIFNGIVRRPFSGSNEVEQKICKAIVLISLQDVARVPIVETVDGSAAEID